MRSSSPTFLSRLGRFALAFTMAGFAVAAQAQSATFQFVDQTNLPAGTYQIYVTGFSANTPYVLQPDGSWSVPGPVAPGTTATLPCYRFPQDITQVQVYNTANKISARVYYFIVTDKTTFPNCNPTAGNTGLFNVPSAFTYTDATSMNLSQPPTSLVASLAFPAWTYSEIGASSTSGTIDLSQVDFYAFPMGTAGTVSSGPSVIGNPVGATANPANAVNHMSIRDAFRTWIDARAQDVTGQSCAVNATPMACAYLDLLQDVTTSGSSVPQYVIQNPGGYLAQYTATTQASRLNHVFDGPIAALWEAASPPSLSIRTGGVLGTVPDDVFTSAIVTIPYPNASPPMNVRAMKFTGTSTSGNYIAYVVDPNDYNTGCQNGSIAGCVNASSPGYQVFAGAGVFGTPSQDFYTALLAGGYLSANAATYGVAGYQNVVARLGFLISGAMNRGVAFANCGANATWNCWQDETYWYPTTASTTFPDITQNLFSRWMHTATIKSTPMFVRPPGALNGASGTPGGGATMGMAYGFSNDENPTPTVPTPPALVSPQPEVPSKLDQTVVFGSTGTITFGPWLTSSTTNPTLSVVVQGQGTVSSTPGDIQCGPVCSDDFPLGQVVTLTAVPATGYVFAQWQNACTGSATTCTVTMSTARTAIAVFTPVASGQFGLTVVVSGSGSVSSTPAGITCGAACSASFASGASVTLTAAPQAGATFAGWSGACSGTATSCVVTMSQARSVGATFAQAGNVTLTVTTGAGGSVVSSPSGIDCGARCVAAYATGTAVTLLPRPAAGYRFVGWGGACTGTQACVVTLTASAAVQASFAPAAAGAVPLTVRNSGGGQVQSTPSGIACGGTCSTSFPLDTRVTLTAVAQPGYTFTGWGGACSGTGTCSVFLDVSTVVDAIFTPQAVPPVTVAPIPTLSQWALIVLAAMLALCAAVTLRKRGEVRVQRGKRRSKR